MAYKPDQRILEACPSCGSGRLLCVLGLATLGLDLCLACFRVWERLPPGEPYTIDSEQLPFKIPCDNCAFRGASPERQDALAWGDLQQMLAMGGAFYCHKGVPFKIRNAAGEPAVAEGARGFEFPRKAATVDIVGECHPYQHYDTERMRLCRGYLNAHIGPLLKKVLSHA
jgi:hypothetical protein